MIVYCITNETNGKKYVGQTVKMPEQRLAQHYRDAAAGSVLPIHQAIRKYGKYSFSISVLSFHNTNEEMSEAEKKAIIELSSHISTGEGYNVTWGGNSLGSGKEHPNFGKKLSEETRKKISDAQIGNNNPSHKNAGAHHWNRGLVRSEETKEKIRIARALQEPTRPKGFKLSEEEKDKISEATKEAMKNPEIRAKIKIARALQVIVHSPETKLKIGTAHLGMKHTEEAKIKMSIASKGRTSPMKGKKHSEEAKEKSRISHLGRKASDETKLKMSISSKAAWERRKKI